MFKLYNLPEWQGYFNKQSMYGAVGANTNSLYGKNVWAAQQISLKILLTLDCGNG